MSRPRIIHGLRAIRRPPPHAVVTVGVFDGVHTAHQRLVRTAVRLAQRQRGTSVVLTFDPDPHHVLDPRHAPPALMSLEERLRALAALRVDWIVVVPFTRRFARMGAEPFVQEVLRRRLGAEAVVLGEAFLFGRNREGDMETLRTVGAACGMRVISVPNVRRGGAVVSSSRIRALIALGQLRQARLLLGRCPSLHGTVVRGAGRGRRLGFPTANIRLASQALPPQGVYAVRLYVERRRRSAVTPPPIRVRGMRTGAKRTVAFGELIGGGVMNLGRRPTFGPGPVVCEVHVLHFSGRLLKRRVVVSLVARLRGERCFASIPELTRQVRYDARRARRLLARS